MLEDNNTVPVDLAAVEATIRSVESATGWSISLLGRTVIYNLFISLAMDQGGFAVPMSASSRKSALKIAQNGLENFLKGLIKKSESLATRSGYRGKEVGFPIVVHEMEGWAAIIDCSCWPD